MKIRLLTTALAWAVLCFVPVSSRSKSGIFTVAGSKKGYFKMKLDGLPKTYDACSCSGFQQDAASKQTYYQVNIFGGVPGDYCGVYVNDLLPVKKGTYTSKLSPVTKLPMAGLGAYKTRDSKDTYISYQAGWPIYDVTISLSEFTPDHIKGTFEGKFRLIGGTKVMSVTDGEFEAFNNP